MISDKRIRESAYPIHMLLQTLRYVVDNAETAEDGFNMHRDERIERWIETLKSGRDDVLKLKQDKYHKSIRSLDLLCNDVLVNFFAYRDVVYLIYTVYFVIKNLTASGKWNIPDNANEKWIEVWGDILEYLEEDQSQMLEGSEKSARKMAGKIVNWLNLRGMYQ